MGLGPDSPWSRVVRRPPTEAILSHIRSQWMTYGETYRDLGKPLPERDEPVLTEGLATFMIDRAAQGLQPFDGEFLAELRRSSLQPDGTTKVIGRTDLEWRLFGFPALVVEFKIIGSGRRTALYLTHGLARFIDGRYGAAASEGAMCALVRPLSAGEDPVSELEGLLDRTARDYRCIEERGVHRFPSALAPSVARFDTLHERDEPRPTLRLAHFFLDIPAPRMAHRPAT
jgi:hypothetical protein